MDDDDDYKTAAQNAQFQAAKAAFIQGLVRNGASPEEAEQLFADMQNDPYHADPDINIYSDPTINERLNRWSGRQSR